nr:hypothetical protein CFP56_17586 [Quercus suber]
MAKQKVNLRTISAKIVTLDGTSTQDADQASGQAIVEVSTQGFLVTKLSFVAKGVSNSPKPISANIFHFSLLFLVISLLNANYFPTSFFLSLINPNINRRPDPLPSDGSSPDDPSPSDGSSLGDSSPSNDSSLEDPSSSDDSSTGDPSSSDGSSTGDLSPSNGSSPRDPSPSDSSSTLRLPMVHLPVTLRPPMVGLSVTLRLPTTPLLISFLPSPLKRRLPKALPNLALMAMKRALSGASVHRNKGDGSGFPLAILLFFTVLVPFIFFV